MRKEFTDDNNDGMPSLLLQTSVMKTRVPLFRSTSSTACSMGTAALTAVVDPCSSVNTSTHHHGVIQWWSNMAGVLLDRMNCTTCSDISNAVELEDDEYAQVREELMVNDYPTRTKSSRRRRRRHHHHPLTKDGVMIAASKATCGVAVPDYYTATADDNITPWSMSHHERTLNDCERIYQGGLPSRTPSALPEILSPPSLGARQQPQEQRLPWTPTRNVKKPRSDGGCRRHHPNHPLRDEEEEHETRHPTPHSRASTSSFSSSRRKAVAPCETETTASMNTRRSVEDSLSSTTDNDINNVKQDDYIHLDEPSLSSSTKELVRRHASSTPPRSSYLKNENSNNKSGSIPSSKGISSIFRKEHHQLLQKLQEVVATTPERRMMNPFARTTGYNNKMASSPTHSTIPTTTSTKTQSQPPILSSPTSSSPLLRKQPIHYFDLPLHIVARQNDNDDNEDDEDNRSTSSSISSLSSGEPNDHHPGLFTIVQQKQVLTQTATTLRRLLVERRPLCVNQ
jgi:hypothetical protein